MKIAEIRKKYQGYSIVESGYEDSIPFTCIPKNSEELEVKGFEVHTKKVVEIDITHCLFGGKKRPNKTYKGIVYVWYK